MVEHTDLPVHTQHMQKFSSVLREAYVLEFDAVHCQELLTQPHCHTLGSASSLCHVLKSAGSCIREWQSGSS